MFSFRARKYQIENEELRQKLKETESNLAELQHIHQVRSIDFIFPFKTDFFFSIECSRRS